YELQLSGTHLAELAPGSQASDRQRRVGARRDDKVQLRCGVFHEGSQRLVQGFVSDDMVVIEYQNHVQVRMLEQIVDKERNDGFELRWGSRRRSVQQRERGGPEVWIKGLESCNQGGEEAHRFVILWIKRHPGNRQLV